MKKDKEIKQLSKTKNMLDTYKKVFIDIADTFVNKYYSYDDESVSEWYVIGEDLQMGWNMIGIGDYAFRSIDDMITCLNLDIPKDLVMEWYISADKKGYRPINLLHMKMNN